MSEMKDSLDKNASTVLDETEMGDISIQDGVIASIAHRAAIHVEGVSRLAGNSIINSVAELVGNRRMQSRNINVTFGEDGDVAIEVKKEIFKNWKSGFCRNSLGYCHDSSEKLRT